MPGTRGAGTAPDVSHVLASVTSAARRPTRSESSQKRARPDRTSDPPKLQPAGRDRTQGMKVADGTACASRRKKAELLLRQEVGCWWCWRAAHPGTRVGTVAATIQGVVVRATFIMRRRSS